MGRPRASISLEKRRSLAEDRRWMLYRTLQGDRCVGGSRVGGWGGLPELASDMRCGAFFSVPVPKTMLPPDASPSPYLSSRPLRRCCSRLHPFRQKVLPRRQPAMLLHTTLLKSTAQNHEASET